MSLESIAAMYRVPAKEGGRVRYTGGGAQKTGTIIGSRNAHLRIKMDDGETGLYHPTWEMEYLPEWPTIPATELETATGLVEAMRQYRHSDGSGVVFGYDLETTQRVVAGLVEALRRIADLPIGPCSTENDYRLSAAKAIAAGVLADHRKEPSHDNQ